MTIMRRRFREVRIARQRRHRHHQPRAEPAGHARRPTPSAPPRLRGHRGRRPLARTGPRSCSRSAQARSRSRENPERNLCKSRNLGIDLAAGEIVAFIDDDGIPEPGWLEELMAGVRRRAHRRRREGSSTTRQGSTCSTASRSATASGAPTSTARPPFDEFNRPGRRPVRLPAGDEHELPARGARGGRRFRREHRVHLGRVRPRPAPDRRWLAAAPDRRRRGAPQDAAEPHAAREGQS